MYHMNMVSRYGYNQISVNGMSVSVLLKDLFTSELKFPDNLLTPTSPIVDLHGIQWVKGTNCSFNVASKGSTQSQQWNKGLI